MSNVEGRFELVEGDFKALLKKSNQDAHALEFTKLFPDFFVSTDKMPRMLREIWRTPVDEYLEKDKGHYFFQEKGCILHLYFEGANKAIAKTKSDVIGRAIKTALQAKLAQGGSVDGESAQGGGKEEKKNKGNENLQKVLEGLRENPSMGEVKIWTTRALQNAHHGRSMPPEIVQLLENYKICFNPFWNAESGVLVGSTCEVNPRGSMAPNEGQIIRDNVAMLGAGLRELVKLSSNQGQAIMVIPIYARSLLEKDIAELTVALLKKTPESLHKSIIFELRGMGKNQLPPTSKGYLQTISMLCRAVTVDTGILSQPDMEKEPFKIHAYGCDFYDVKLPPQEMMNLMKKYASTYTARGAKTFIKNLPNALAVEMAQKFGFTYISSPPLFRPRLSCPSATRMTIEEIKALGQKTPTQG